MIDAPGLGGAGRSRGPGAPSARCPSLHERRRGGDRRARAIVALGDGEPGPPDGGRRIDQQDEAELLGWQEDRHRRRRQIGRGDLQPRRSPVQVESRNIGDDRRDVRADVGRLGQQRRVADEARLEPIAGVAGAREHHVVVARPGVEIERQADGAGGGARLGAKRDEELDRVVAPGDRRRAQRERAGQRARGAPRDRRPSISSAGPPPVASAAPRVPPPRSAPAGRRSSALERRAASAGRQSREANAAPPAALAPRKNARRFIRPRDYNHGTEPGTQLCKPFAVAPVRRSRAGRCASRAPILVVTSSRS